MALSMVREVVTENPNTSRYQPTEPEDGQCTEEEAEQD